MFHLFAVHLYDRSPSPISTAKISKVTKHGSWFSVKQDRNLLTNVEPARKKILVKLYAWESHWITYMH